MDMVDQMYQEFETLATYLEETTEISLKGSAENQFRIALLLAATNHLEYRLRDNLLNIFQLLAFENEPLVAFIKHNIFQEQTKVLFPWRNKSTLEFFALFGDSFQALAQAEIERQPVFNKGCHAFFELSEIHHQLSNRNLKFFTTAKTTGDVYTLYQQARLFTEIFPQLLQKHWQMAK